MNVSAKHELSPKERVELLNILKLRFEKNRHRHKGIEWNTVMAKLQAHPKKLWSLHEMERTGGEPDFIGIDTKTGEYLFFIALKKALKVEEVSVMTTKHSKIEKNINQKTVQ
jgi:hypothetical protein